LDDNIPPLSKKHKHQNNFIDNSMEVPPLPSLSNHEPQPLPTTHVLNTAAQPLKIRFRLSITKEELEEENRRLACEQADTSHSSVEEDEAYQSTIEESLKPAIIETPDASSIKIVGKGQDIIRPQPLVTTQDNFFKPRQQTSVAQTKLKAIEAGRRIEKEKKETTILDSGFIGGKEKLEKLKKLQPSHPHILTEKKKENISPMNRKRSSSLNDFFPPKPKKNDTEAGFKRKLSLLTRK
jgi:hypothetical protein